MMVAARLPPAAAPYTLFNVTELAAAILRNAVKDDGPSYMLDPCARWWCDVLGMNPVFLHREASQIAGQLRPYTPRPYCVLRRPRDGYGRFVKVA